jgi:ParB family chromosome partitioning protein
MSIQIIPLNKLRLSPHNVRKTGAEDNLDELVANIEAHGVLQNLIGGAAKKRGFFDIFAGGRRLRALNRLAESGKLAVDVGVPVKLLEQSTQNIAETSLAENFIRLGMTPTDECKAFLHFLGSDGDVDAVAKRFGQTRRFVEGRLRLATLAPPVFDALATGDMTMDIAKAYAATPDQAKQLAVFEEVKNSWLATNAHEIKKRILGQSIPASHPVAQLVGEERYAAAGGRIERDLYTAAESAEWLDGPLAQSLAAAIMQDAAARLAEETGVGTIVPLLAKGSTWTDREDLTQARLEREPVSETDQARIDEIEGEIEIIENRFESEDLEEEEGEALNARVEALGEERARLHDTPVTIDADRKATLTQFVVIGADGTPTVEPGYWEEPRRHRGQGGDGSAPHADAEKVAAKAQGLSGVLADELSMARRDVLALHIASDPGVALDLAIFALAEKAMGHDGDTGTSLAVNRRNDPLAKNGLPDSPAGGALAEIRKNLDTSWSDHETVAARFDAFRTLDDDCRANWLAVCMASSIEASLGGQGIGRHNAFHDHLGQLLEIDVASWWRPSAGGYFARVRKAGMQRTLEAIGGPVLAARYASAKSAEMADACEKLCDGSAITEPEIRDAGLAWVPTAMRFDAGGAVEPADADSGTPGDEREDDRETETGAHEDVQCILPKDDWRAQYRDLKAEVGDAILLFRMGDFYEAFGPDALAVAPILDLALTQRRTGEAETEMVGIPVHAAEAHVARLVSSGHAVAIAERVEDGAHAIVRIVAVAADANAADCPEAQPGHASERTTEEASAAA